MRIATYENYGTVVLIADDIGPYEGTLPEYGVRRLQTVVRLEHLTIINPIYAAIVARGAGYGCGWGDTGKLHPINEADQEALVAEDARIGDISAKQQAEIEAEEDRRAAILASSGLCPRCGTWCYSDCQAD